MSGWFDKFRDGRTCSLTIEGPREALSVETAWALLPASGEGWVCLTDGVRRFEPGWRNGVLLDAEVADGASTVVLRHQDGVWRAWTWHERPGTTHRAVRRVFLSSAPSDGGQVPRMEYATYWKQETDDDGIQVWNPVGSRFCRWEVTR